MKFNEALQKKLMENSRKIFERNWKIILFNPAGIVLGESGKFRFYPDNGFNHFRGIWLTAKPIQIPISITGILHYIIMAEFNRDSFPETIRDYSKLIGRMNRRGKSTDEILKKILTTRDRYEIVLSAGTSGCDLTVGNIYLNAGSTFIIDSFNLKI